MRREMRKAKGYALITSLIILTVTAGLVVGFLAQVNTQQKIGYNDGDYSTAFYAAEAGLEKLNSDLSKLFFLTVYPTAAQINNIQGGSYQPGFPSVKYTTYSVVGGQQAHLNGAINSTVTAMTVDSTTGWPGSGYFMIDGEYMTYTGLTATTFTGLVRGANGTTAATHTNNARVSRSQVITLSQGPNAGLNAQVIPFTLQVVAQGASGTEAKLNRDIQVALVPVFQFGVFSDSDLSFFAGPNFNFGGRVHTNGNLFLAEGAGNTLTLAQKVTAALDVIRTNLGNGGTLASNNSTGTVNVTTSGNGAPYRALSTAEGSLTGGPGSPTNPTWQSLSLTTYNGKILNGATGAKPLTLPFAGPGVGPVEIIKRSPAAEDPQSIISESRLYNQASLRVLISDAQANLPGGVGYPLNSNIQPPTGTYTVDNSHPPFAVADPGDSDYVTALNLPETANTPLIDGFIKIEMQKNDSSWQDVTMEILNQGISAGNDVAATPNPNAILRFQRLKPAKTYPTTIATDFMPINLFDPREARFRDSATNGLPKIGIMQLVELDVSNLAKWFAGSGAYAGLSGTNALNNSGYIFYFSDRRGNRNAGGNETGEFGFEDIVNSPDVNNGSPDNILETGEDFNGNGTLETYGGNSPVTPFTAYPVNTDLYNTLTGPPQTTLNGAISSATNPPTGASVNVASTAGWSAPGSLIVDGENISFTGTTATSFTGITRGAYGTTANSHGNGANVYGLGEHYGSVTVNGSTALSANMSSSSNPGVGGTITVGSTVSFPPAPASIQIGSEIITYSAMTTTTFTVAARGAYGTGAVSHSSGAAVSEPAIASSHPVTGDWMGVSSTVGWGTSGYLQVGTEYITYSSKTPTSINVMTRGAFGSTAAAHTNGDVARNFPAGQKNRVWYFRRALRLVNGAAPNLPTPGFTVASENPVYVLGDYNANGSFTGSHSYAAVIADAFTFLSNKWNDIESFEYPYTVGSRTASTTWYRIAIAAGKGPSFPQLGPAADYGTDGGTHNFLRYIENWGGQTLNYLGSIVSLYFSRQGTGTYKCCTTVYNPPIRAYTFDTDFLVPSQLPPGTPRFRDVNNLSFRQNILANQ